MLCNECGRPAHDQCDPCQDMASGRTTTLGEKLDRALDDNQRLRDALERTSGFLKEHEMALEYWEDQAKQAIREREDYNGKHQLAVLEIERLRAALQAVMVAKNDPYEVARKALRMTPQVTSKER